MVTKGLAESSKLSFFIGGGGDIHSAMYVCMSVTGWIVSEWLHILSWFFWHSDFPQLVLQFFLNSGIFENKGTFLWNFVPSCHGMMTNQPMTVTC